MELDQLRFAPDEYAMRLAQFRTHSHNVRDTYFTWLKEPKNMSLADKARAKAANLRNSTNKPNAEKKSAQTTETRRHSKRERHSNQDTEKLRAKVLEMRKKDMGFAEIADKLNISDSYAWVLAKNYKYDPDKAKKSKKTNKKAA